MITQLTFGETENYPFRNKVFEFKYFFCYNSGMICDLDLQFTAIQIAVYLCSPAGGNTNLLTASLAVSKQSINPGPMHLKNERQSFLYYAEIQQPNWDTSVWGNMWAYRLF